jgi:hypothetical protein
LGTDGSTPGFTNADAGGVVAVTNETVAVMHRLTTPRATRRPTW